MEFKKFQDNCNSAKKEFENKNFDSALYYNDLSLNSLPPILKELSEPILKFKAVILNNKALSLSDDKIEECLNLLNQAIEIDPNNGDFKNNRFVKFRALYVKKIKNKNFQEIPIIFYEAMKYKYLSKEMEDYLNINKSISNYFDRFYGNEKEIISIQKYKIGFSYFLDYIRYGDKEDDFEGKCNLLLDNFLGNIEKDAAFFLSDKKNSFGVLYDTIINNINDEMKKLD